MADSILKKGASELRTLRRELGTHWLIRRVLHDFKQEDYSQLVDSLNASARASLGEINRDESTRLLWSVVLRQPKLLLLGLRGLLLGKKKCPRNVRFKRHGPGNSAGRNVNRSIMM